MSQDTVPALPAVTRNKPIRGHRPSILSGAGSIDLSEAMAEERDTVAMNDSDTWYPQFSPAASLPQAKKIESEKQTGLTALLQNRMNKSDFETRFLGGEEFAKAMNISHAAKPPRMATQEASSESLFNRSAKLGALLANRPDKQRLEALNIIKGGQGGPGRAATGAFAGMQAKLDASQKKDRLNSLLSARPAAESLVKRGVLTGIGESPSAKPAAQERLASAKSALGGFFASRPAPEQLVQQKIITDVGDLPGGLERKQENQLVPLAVAALANLKIMHVSLGFSHTLALDADGTVHVFGSGANGRLGVAAGSLSDVAQPQALPASHFAGEKVVQIDAGENHSAAITSSGKLFTWGTGAWGRLGSGNQDDQTLPLHVYLPENELAAHVSCGAYHTLVLTQSKKLFAFGWNKNGRCGVGRKHPTLMLLAPVEVAFFSSPERTVATFEAGAGGSYALTTQGECFLWGTGAFGALGFGDEQDVWEPKLLVSPSASEPFVRLALGATHTLAATTKHLYSFGSSDKGQLGRTPEKDDAATSAAASVTSPTATLHKFASSYTPGLVAPPTAASSVAASSTTSTSSVTLPTSDPVIVRSLAAGKSHSLYATDAGVFAFGMGSRGLLGIGDEHDQHAPVAVAGLLQEKVLQVDASWTHSAAVTESGKLFTWGAKHKALGH